MNPPSSTPLFDPSPHNGLNDPGFTTPGPDDQGFFDDGTSNDVSTAESSQFTLDLGKRGRTPWALLALGVFGAGVISIMAQQGRLDRLALGATIAWTLVLLVAAAAGIGAAAQRDIISRVTLLDALGLTAAISLFSWMYPRFSSSLIGWDETQRLYLAAIGASLGALLASIVILGLIRRPPSAASASFLAALALLLVARVAFYTTESAAALLLFAAFAALAVSWSARPVPEPEWSPPQRRLRVPRWILSLAAAGTAGTAIETALTVERPSQPMTAIALAVLIVVLAVVSVLFARNDLRFEQGAFDDWVSWKHAAFDRDFETALYSEGPAAVPSEGMVKRPLSEWTTSGELRLADESFWAILGIAPQTAFHFGSIAHPDDRAGLAQALSLAIVHGRKIEHQFRAVDPTSGRERTVRLQAVPSESGTALIEAGLVERSEPTTTLRPGFDNPKLRHTVTGLRNTSYVERWLQRYADENRRHTDNATLVIIEAMPLGYFDALPNVKRDHMMIDVGHRLDAIARMGDFLAHLDGPYLLFGARLAIAEDRNGLLARIANVLDTPIDSNPPVRLQHRMVTLRVEPGVDISRVLGVAAAAFTTDLP